MTIDRQYQFNSISYDNEHECFDTNAFVVLLYTMELNRKAPQFACIEFMDFRSVFEEQQSRIGAKVMTIISTLFTVYRIDKKRMREQNTHAQQPQQKSDYTRSISLSVYKCGIRNADIIHIFRILGNKYTFCFDFSLSSHCVVTTSANLEFLIILYRKRAIRDD